MTKMTIEEAINHGKEQLEEIFDEEHREFIELAIKALEQQSCDDCISRQAVLDIAKSSKSNWIDNSVLFKRVNELPSATPQPKVGHWIKEKSLNGWDSHSYQCSVCGRSIHLDTEIETLDDYSYCHCGAKMEEEE